MELAKVVGAHDPNEIDAGRSAPEPPKRIIGKVRVDLRLDVAYDDPGPNVEPARGLHARLERREPGQRLQWISGRHQPPDAVELETAQRKPRDERMPLVRRIERPAEEANAHSRRKGWQTRNRRHDAACAAKSSA